GGEGAAEGGGERRPRPYAAAAGSAAADRGARGAATVWLGANRHERPAGAVPVPDRAAGNAGPAQRRRVQDSVQRPRAARWAPGEGPARCGPHTARCPGTVAITGRAPGSATPSPGPLGT